MKPEEQMLICAVRYALGRMSYIVGVTCEFVAKNREKLSDNCIKILIRDIEEELDMYSRVGKTCGMACDHHDWLKLLEVLKEQKETGKEETWNV